MSKNCRIEFIEGELTCLCNHRDYRNCDLYEEDDETYNDWEKEEMNYNADIKLPIENIDGDERSTMDGLIQDFVKTMVNLGTAIANDKKWAKKEIVSQMINDQSPVYIIRKVKDERDATVIFAWEIYGGKVHGSIGITVDYKYDKTYMSMSGMNEINGFSAIAAVFAKIYREYYAEIHNA